MVCRRSVLESCREVFDASVEMKTGLLLQGTGTCPKGAGTDRRFRLAKKVIEFSHARFDWLMASLSAQLQNIKGSAAHRHRISVAASG